MALFIVRHQHDAERCPATDPYIGATLLNHLSRPNLRKYSIEIQGEAIVRGDIDSLISTSLIASDTSGSEPVVRTRGGCSVRRTWKRPLPMGISSAEAPELGQNKGVGRSAKEMKCPRVVGSSLAREQPAYYQRALP